MLALGDLAHFLPEDKLVRIVYICAENCCFQGELLDNEQRKYVGPTGSFSKLAAVEELVVKSCNDNV